MSPPPNRESRLSWLQSLSRLWSTTRFRAPELSAYAEKLMLGETRRGVMAMSLVFAGLQFSAATFYHWLELDSSYVYTAVALGALGLHIGFSARAIHAIDALHMLAVTLFTISGTAYVLLAHKTGAFNTALFMSVGLLIMIVALVPWGLRESSVVTLLVYGVFTFSSWTVRGRFDQETLWSLQSFMAAAAVISLTIVARAVSVRKGDIQVRFDLERARSEMELLSYQDPLTGAWNRRFLEDEFRAVVESVQKSGTTLHLALLDVDHFKSLNDTCGHTYGDEVLRAVSEAFREQLGEAGHLVRTGGDEFTVLIDNDEAESLIHAALEAVQERLAQIARPDAPAFGMSVGLVSVPPDVGITLDEAYKVADKALYRAKGARGEPGSSRVVPVTLRARELELDDPRGRE